MHVKRSKDELEKPRICIDYDRTIAPWPEDIDGKEFPYNPMVVGKPTPEAVGFIKAMHERGYEIIILSCRAADEGGHQAIMKELDWADIPWTEITNIKRAAKYYIDDRGIRFNGDWVEVYDFISMLEGWGEQ